MRYVLKRKKRTVFFLILHNKKEKLNKNSYRNIKYINLCIFNETSMQLSCSIGVQDVIV